MAKEQDEAPQDASEDERYRYIGFDVFPKSDSAFWKDESEQAQHLARVKETHGQFVPLSRSNSIVAANLLGTWERIILTATSLALLLAPILPWFSFTRGNDEFAYSGVSLLIGISPILSYFSMGEGALTTGFLLMVSLMVLSMLFGGLTLFGLYTGSDNLEKSQSRLKRILNLHYLPLLGWIVFFVMAMSPTGVPFGASLGLSEIEGTLDLGALVDSSSIGLWIPFSVLWVNAIKGNEL